MESSFVEQDIILCTCCPAALAQRVEES